MLLVPFQIPHAPSVFQTLATQDMTEDDERRSRAWGDFGLRGGERGVWTRGTSSVLEKLLRLLRRERDDLRGDWRGTLELK